MVLSLPGVCCTLASVLGSNPQADASKPHNFTAAHFKDFLFLDITSPSSSEMPFFPLEMKMTNKPHML